MSEMKRTPSSRKGKGKTKEQKLEEDIMADQPSESATNMQARQKKRSSAQKKESETKEAATAATAMKRQRVEEHPAEHGKNACNHTYIPLLFVLHFYSD